MRTKRFLQAFLRPANGPFYDVTAKKSYYSVLFEGCLSCLLLIGRFEG